MLCSEVWPRYVAVGPGVPVESSEVCFQRLLRACTYVVGSHGLPTNLNWGGGLPNGVAGMVVLVSDPDWYRKVRGKGPGRHPPPNVEQGVQWREDLTARFKQLQSTIVIKVRMKEEGGRIVQWAGDEAVLISHMRIQLSPGQVTPGQVTHAFVGATDRDLDEGIVFCSGTGGSSLSVLARRSSEPSSPLAPLPIHGFCLAFQATDAPYRELQSAFVELGSPFTPIPFSLWQQLKPEAIQRPHLLEAPLAPPLPNYMQEPPVLFRRCDPPAELSLSLPRSYYEPAFVDPLAPQSGQPAAAAAAAAAAIPAWRGGGTQCACGLRFPPSGGEAQGAAVNAPRCAPAGEEEDPDSQRFGEIVQSCFVLSAHSVYVFSCAFLNLSVDLTNLDECCSVRKIHEEGAKCMIVLGGRCPNCSLGRVAVIESGGVEPMDTQADWQKQLPMLECLLPEESSSGSSSSSAASSSAAQPAKEGDVCKRKLVVIPVDDNIEPTTDQEQAKHLVAYMWLRERKRSVNEMKVCVSLCSI
uniref:Uncharacterized protein n=1 Tax=Chromera velia CCMP2878 TaxID=1169474 RepID=A0A0G4G6N0_9ALVE|eukprot:Cvel_4255.t1-p1 / transcript=Cvel_4255.t1 / gene=Cvel_4255 / organism=Chromera_velia_CCMP2878 / gene_product=hypothetical protein / transcript_product=hypothetical protein / location=Cvel_scaffold184:48631-51173(-) / protein_length=523 / sequence_SO=supercontig / SO=protein_coding / is_pseudo=false